MAKLSLTVACWEYDRTRPLMQGRIQPEGIDLQFTCLRPEDTFQRQVERQEFDVSEFSLSYHTFLCSRGGWPYTGIPVFLSRFFRHSCIYVNTGAGIQTPQDLAGKTVGVPWYPMTAAVWMRAFLQHDYALPPEAMTWLYAHDVFPWTPPPGLSLKRIDRDQSLEKMLETGEIAALLTARQPAPFVNGSPHVARLFPDSRKVEEEYFARTKLFPVMHTVVVRRAVLEKYPWVAISLLRAFEQAKQLAHEDLHETDALRFMLPWLVAEAERTEQVMGKNFWPYGLEANRHVVQALIKYSHEQGLALREMPLDQVYVAIEP